MGKVSFDNENLFRALICAPVAVFFALMAAEWVMSSGPIVLNVIFVVMALLFSLTTLAYLSHYTNERFEGKADPVCENTNLGKAITNVIFTVLFVSIAVNTVPSSAHIFFKALSVMFALYFSLSLLAYLAFFTNDYFAEQFEH
ncbi:hypothetical protein ACFSJY_12430 [Thalassotalea euphylliae]|uniref:hypothetical protein n=1 Tax=Thalassotalea euphylliae TaxID=1655234 RepID=UPI003625172B